MTNTAKTAKLELIYTDAQGKSRVLVSNTQVHGPEGAPKIWSITHRPKDLEGIDWSVLRSASYLCLHAACERLPVEPQWAEGVAAVAAYRAADQMSKRDTCVAKGFMDGGAQLEQKKHDPCIRDAKSEPKGPERWLAWKPYADRRGGELTGFVATSWSMKRTPLEILEDLMFMSDVGESLASPGSSGHLVLPPALLDQIKAMPLTAAGTLTVLDHFNRDCRSRTIHSVLTNVDDPTWTGVHISYAKESSKSIRFEGLV